MLKTILTICLTLGSKAQGSKDPADPAGQGPSNDEGKKDKGKDKNTDGGDSTNKANTDKANQAPSSCLPLQILLDSSPEAGNEEVPGHVSLSRCAIQRAPKVYRVRVGRSPSRTKPDGRLARCKSRPGSRQQHMATCGRFGSKLTCIGRS